MKRRNVSEKSITRRIILSRRMQDLGVILLFIFILPYVTAVLFGNVGRASATGSDGPAAARANGRLSADSLWDEKDSDILYIRNTTAAGTETIPMEDYLIQRLCSSIPMDYEPETLKAQAVILRTQLIRKYEEQGKAKPYVETEADLPIPAPETYELSRTAVESTRGMYLTYQKKAAVASYFAVSAGSTRNAEEAFGSREYPYLKTVLCERDFLAQDYSSKTLLEPDLFLRQLQQLFPNMAEITPADVGKTIGSLTMLTDSSGYVTQVKYGSESVPGEKFRLHFSLPSACFHIEETDGHVRIEGKGSGYGLGMSQFGANEMAREGKDFVEILSYFFEGASIEKS